MSEPLALEVDATHLYPGARGRLAGRRPVSGIPTACTLIFSDFTRVAGSIRWAGGNDGRLNVESYVTAAGTRIPPKAWVISLSPQRDTFALRVQSRLSEG
jgi:hypothetical protein